MAGNKEGGKKAARTNKRKYGKDFYGRIGQLGGRIGTTGGFWADRELASRAGKVGGTISRKSGPNKRPMTYAVTMAVEPAVRSRWGFRRKIR